MRRATTIALAVVVALASLAGVVFTAFQAQANSQEQFFQKLLRGAQQSERDYGIPTSVTLAQAAIESGWGRSSLTVKGNNYFGIKCFNKGGPIANGCMSVQTTEYRPDGSSYTITASFRTYASVGDSVKDHANFLKVNSRYAKAFNYSAQPDQFIREVHRAGYATDPGYADMLIRFMKRYDLYRYDVGSDTKPPAPIVTPPKPGTVATRPPTLRQGQRSDAVRSAQYLLAAKGLPVSKTGYFGSQTTTQVRAFQKSRGLRVDGIVGRDTWAALHPTLSRGARGDAVRALQLELNASGARIYVDGVYGSRTEAAVKTFQKAKKLPVTGRADARVWTALLGS